MAQSIVCTCVDVRKNKKKSIVFTIQIESIFSSYIRLYAHARTQRLVEKSDISQVVWAWDENLTQNILSCDSLQLASKQRYAKRNGSIENAFKYFNKRNFILLDPATNERRTKKKQVRRKFTTEKKEVKFEKKYLRT